MRRWITFFMLLAVTCTAVTVALAQVKVNDTPTINWKTVDGKAVTNQELKGRIIIIDFWATWCGPCMAEAENMVNLAKEYGPKGVNIIGVSLDKDIEKMKKIAKEKGFDWPQVCDGKGWNSPPVKEWGVKGIPDTFILSPEGKVLWRGHPAQIKKPLEEIVKQHGKK